MKIGFIKVLVAVLALIGSWAAHASTPLTCQEFVTVEDEPLWSENNGQISRVLNESCFANQSVDPNSRQHHFRIPLVIPPGSTEVGYWIVTGVIDGECEVQDSAGRKVGNIDVSGGGSAWRAPDGYLGKGARPGSVTPLNMSLNCNMTGLVYRFEQILEISADPQPREHFECWRNPANCPYFRITLDRQSLEVRGQSTLTATNGTIASCISDNTAVASVSVNGSGSGGTVTAGSTTGTATITCTSTATPAEQASATVTVSAPTSSFTLSPSSLSIAANGSGTLTATNGTIASCVSSDPTKTTFTGSGSSVTVTVTGVSVGTNIIITCTSNGTTPASASATVTVTQTTPTPDPNTGSGTATPTPLSKYPGQTFIQTASGTAVLQSCSSGNQAVVANPLTVVSGNTFSGSVLGSAHVGDKALVACLHTDNTTSSTYLITVVAPPGVTLSAVPQLTPNSATFSATAGAAATGYWIVRTKGSDGAPPATPTAAEIFEATTGRGSAPLAANTAAAITLSGLTADTDYGLFFFARETTSNFDTPVQVRQFHTPAIPVPQEVLTGTASGSYDAFSLSATITPQSALLNQQGNYYLRADVPGLGVFSLVNTSSGQGRWDLGMHNYFAANTALGTQPISALSNFVLMPLFSQLAGTTIRAGYITGASEANHSQRVYTIGNSLPTLTATPAPGQNKLTVTFGGSAAQAWWQRLDADVTDCPAAAAVKQANPANSLTASAELPLTGLAPDTPYTVCFAVEDDTGILGSSIATAVPFTSIPASATLSDAEAITATAAAFRVTPEVAGTGKWLVKPAGETAPTDAEFAASARTHALTAQGSSFTVNRLTPATAYKAYFRLDYSSAGAARTSQVLEKTFTTPALTLDANLPDTSHVQGTSATLGAQSNGDGLLYWRVRPAGETAVPAADAIKTEGRVVPQIAGLPARIVVSGLTAGTAQNVDFLMSAGGVEEVKTVAVTTSTTVADSQFKWETVDSNLQAIIAPANFMAGATGQYYVYVVLRDNTLIFARDNNGTAGGHAQTFQQNPVLQPYFATGTMEASKVLTLVPATPAINQAFSGVEVYAGYRIGTTANDPVYWGLLNTFP